MVEHRLSVTAVDIPGTRSVGDGFFVKPSTLEVFFVTIVPDLTKCNREAIQASLQVHDSRKRSSGTFFGKDFGTEELGLERNNWKPVIVYRTSPSRAQQSISLGIAKLTKVLGFSRFDGEYEDEQVRLLRQYADSHIAVGAHANEIVTHLMKRMNEAVRVLMHKEQIPFIGEQSRRLLVCSGKPAINRALRDAASFMNILQLEKWLREEECLFTERQLQEAISVVST